MKLSIFSRTCWINTHVHMYTHTPTHTAARNSCFETLEQKHGREKSPTRISCRYVCVWLSPLPTRLCLGTVLACEPDHDRPCPSTGYPSPIWSLIHLLDLVFIFFVHVLSDTWHTCFEPYSPRCNLGSNPPPEVGCITWIAIRISAFTRTQISLIRIGSRVKGLL